MTGRIIGTGSYVPERIVTNEELAEVVETSDEWIVTRTGIHERRIAETEGTSVLAARAAERALKNANVSAEEVDFILLSFSNEAPEITKAVFRDFKNNIMFAKPRQISLKTKLTNGYFYD